MIWNSFRPTSRKHVNALKHDLKAMYEAPNPGATAVAWEEAVRPRENVNRARAKTWPREIPADADLFRLYSDCLYEEYGLLHRRPDG